MYIIVINNSVTFSIVSNTGINLNKVIKQGGQPNYGWWLHASNSNHHMNIAAVDANGGLVSYSTDSSGLGVCPAF